MTTEAVERFFESIRDKDITLASLYFLNQDLKHTKLKYMTAYYL